MRGRVLLGCIAALGLSIAAAQQSRQEDAAKVAQSGVEAAQRGDFRTAITDYKKAQSLDPGLPGIWLNLGLAYFKLGDFHAAANAFEKEVAKSPADRPKTLLAMSYFGLGRYADASHLLEPIAAAQPDNTELAYLLAKCYLWSGQNDRATDLFQKLLERDPDSAAVHMLIGEALDAQRRTSDAIPEFQAAVKSSPSQPDVHFGLGYLYWEMRQYTEAEREFRRELDVDPMNARANAYLGDLLMKTGRSEEAVPFLEKAAAPDADLQVAHEDLAVVCADRKQYDKAITEFQTAIRIDPGSYDAHYRLARLYQQLGRESEAQRQFAIVRNLHARKAEEPLMKISGPK